MHLIEYIFIFAIFGSIYSYFVYPLLLLPFQGRNQYKFEHNIKDENLPALSFIITAYNEEKQIAGKIENTLQANYPKDRLEILVASDGSTDKTHELVKNYKDQGVVLVEVIDRKGKENAQLHAIQQAKGEILIFSDASTQIEDNALHIIAQAFNNPSVGGISSEDRFITTDGKIAGEGAYVKYEMWLRKLESKAYSLVGLSGSFFACRSSICHDWKINIPSDFNTAINCVRNHYSAVTHPELLGYYPNIKDETKEFPRKVRTVLRGMAALFSDPKLLNPFKYGFFSFELISHKLMRWMVPWFMLTALTSNFLMVGQSNIYTLTFIVQIAFYLIALMGHLSSELRNNKLIKIIYFFVQVNLAIAQAMLMYLTGKRITQWEPSKR